MLQQQQQPWCTRPTPVAVAFVMEDQHHCARDLSASRAYGALCPIYWRLAVRVGGNEIGAGKQSTRNARAGLTGKLRGRGTRRSIYKFVMTGPPRKRALASCVNFRLRHFHSPGCGFRF